MRRVAGSCLRSCFNQLQRALRLHVERLFQYRHLDRIGRSGLAHFSRRSGDSAYVHDRYSNELMTRAIVSTAPPGGS
jgi:hypothetical protein